MVRFGWQAINKLFFDEKVKKKPIFEIVEKKNLLTQ